MSYHRVSLGQDLDPMTAQMPELKLTADPESPPIKNAVDMGPAIRAAWWAQHKTKVMLGAAALVGIGLLMARASGAPAARRRKKR